MNWSLVDVVQGVPEASICRDTPIVVGRVFPKKKKRRKHQRTPHQGVPGASSCRDAPKIAFGRSLGFRV